MHLERLSLSTFRSCRDSDVWFQPGLTVLVGENNSGKSNIIDAIRLLTGPSDGRRTRFADVADISFEADPQSFSLQAVYGGLSLAQQALFLAASNGVGTAEISHRVRFAAPLPTERRGRTTWTLGANDAIDPEPSARDQIRHVYLPPLRDAQQALSSGAGERIEFVLRALAAGTEIDTLEGTADAALETLAADPLIARADGAIASRVGDLTRGSIPQSSKLGFSEPHLRQLARTLRVRLAEAGIEPVDLTHSGLGYANLLFLATVVVELEATKDADLTVFLVEEPEAHLHPQLQTAVLDFLASAARDTNGNHGDTQVIVTTHSAQLASAVDSAQIEVIKTRPVAADPLVRSSKAVPIWKLPLLETERRKVDRYINATRSPLIFGPTVMLVEGIAEAILLPSLARRFLPEAAQARFRGTALVAIDGVDFDPYVRLLLTQHNGVSVAERLVVVTDSDPAAPGDRVAHLQAIGTQLEAGARMQVKASTLTLEADLYAAGNAACLEAGFLAQRPQSQHVWDSLAADHHEAERPAALTVMFRDKKVSKGDLAQHIAAWVDNDQPFDVPPYLTEALAAVCDDP